MRTFQRALFLGLMASVFLSVVAGHAHAQEKNNDEAAQKARNDNVVFMDTFEVNSKAKKYRWRYATSAHFEILSSIDDLKLVGSIIQEAEQIIGLFERACAIFRIKRDLPAKVIFIKDQGVERFFTDNVKNYDPDDFDAPTFGVNGLASKNLHQVSARCDANDEQVIFIKLITQQFLDSQLSDHHKIHENSVDLAISYLHEALALNASAKNVDWFDYVLNGFRGHSPGGLSHVPWAQFSDTYGYYSTHRFMRPGWLDIYEDKITIGRYCLACEGTRVKQLPPFSKLNDEGRAAFWADFMSHPYVPLGTILETHAYREKPPKESLAEVDRYFVMQRELRDFADYCTFGPNEKIRVGFSHLLNALATEPMSETLFKKYLGRGYNEFSAEIYSFYTNLTRNLPEYENNPWGPQSIVIARFSPERIPKLPALADAKRNESGRIISDWFTIAGRNDLALRTLHNALNDDPVAVKNDPNFFVALGICEDTNGNSDDALKALETAAAGNVTRPQAYRALARLRLERILKIKGADYHLDKAEVDSVLDPLLTAMSQSQPNEQTYWQCMTLWQHTDEKPPAKLLSQIAEGCRLFPNDRKLLDAAQNFLKANKVSENKSL